MSNREITVPLRLKPEEALRLDTQRNRLGLNRSAYTRQALMERLERDEAKQRKASKKDHAEGGNS